MGNSILFITDPFDSLKQEKDTSIFIMKEALRRDFEVFQCEICLLYTYDAADEP